LKKILYIISVFVILILASFYFTTTEYFFNRYLAPRIKEYSFNYSSVNGTLLNGFRVKDLSYKNSKLSSEVEFRFNPLKLITKTISINKLHLKNVNKKSLNKIINDFRPSSSSSKNIEVGFNLEFKNIFLNFKPFEFEGIKIDNNNINIDYIAFKDGSLNLGKSKYSYKTSLGNIAFMGQFKNRELFIERLLLKNVDINKILLFVNRLKEQKSFESNSTIKSSDIFAFLPKKIKLNRALITLKPFKIEDLKAKDITIDANNILFDVQNLELKKAALMIDYKSNLANLQTNATFANNVLNIDNLNIDILKPNKILNYLDSNSSSNSASRLVLAIFPLKKINLNNSNIKLSNLQYKNQTISTLKLKSCISSFDLDSLKLSSKELLLDLNSSVLNANISAKIDKKIIINEINATSKNADMLLEYLNNFKTKSTSKTKFANNLFIAKANLNFNKLSFLPYIINKGYLRAKNVDIVFDKFAINSGYLSVYNNSNWGEATLKGDIKNSNFYATGGCKVNQVLCKEYELPLIAKNINKLKVKGRFGLKSFELTANLNGKNILKDLKHFDVIDSTNIVKYNYISDDTIWSIRANASLPYAKNFKIQNTLEYLNQKLTYKGVVTPNKKLGIGSVADKLLDNLKFNYVGDSKKLDILFKSNKLKGKLSGRGYSGGKLKIENISAIKLGTIANVGSFAKDAQINKMVVNTDINYKKLLPLKGNVLLESNFAKIDGLFDYSNNLTLKLKAKKTNNTIISKKIKCNNIFPMDINIATNKNRVDIKTQNKLFKTNTNIFTNSDKIDATLTSSSIKANAKGKINNLDITLKSSNIGKAVQEIAKVCKINTKANIKGSLNIKAKLANLNRVNLTATSKSIEYISKKNNTVLKDILLQLNYKDDSLAVGKYKFKINGYDIYSNKSNAIKFNNGNIVFSNFWVNDLALLNGNYNIDNSKGKLTLKSSNFQIKNSDIDANLMLDTKITINADKYSISGIVNILKANVKKNINNQNVSSNEDIIILQKQQAKKSTKYARNVKLDLKVLSKGGIRYLQGGAYFKLYPKLKIKKNYNQLSAFDGIVKIDKKSYYIFKRKKFKLKKGHISFKGKSAIPYLNLTMTYSSRDYDITINISGTTARPILYFSSNPPMTKDEILAYILFGDSGAAGTHSQKSMLNLIGGTLAKSFFGAIGLKIDHILIKEKGFSIGKNISDNVTIYYNQEDNKPSVKTRIDIIKSIHTEIKVGEESQSADIIFSKEY